MSLKLMVASLTGHRSYPGCHKRSLLSPLLLCLYINDISNATESEVRLFADDCVRYREEKKMILMLRQNSREIQTDWIVSQGNGV